jgi:hypothetical protein
MGDSMSTIINATTTNGVVIQPDNSGSLVLQTNSGTTALTIDTSQRAAFVAGTAAAPAITTTGDTNTGIWFPAADTIAFAEGGTESMRIDSSGNVGIGTTSPANKLQVTDGAVSTTGVVRIHNPTNANDNFGAALLFSNENGGTKYDLGQISAIRTNNVANYDGALVFSSSANAVLTERMRITAAGEVYIAGTTDRGAFNLQCNGTGVWGAGAYTNGSDERIKENITPIDSGLDVVAKLNPVTYKYKEEWSRDQSIQIGFIAQDLLVALEGKNYVDGIVNQSSEYMSVAYQNIIPILTKAIQEQQTIINNLKARVETLEAK